MIRVRRHVSKVPILLRADQCHPNAARARGRRAQRAGDGR